MVADAMTAAPVDSRFGKLPASDSELNGDYLQVLPRLALMTGDDRFLEWGRRIADAYIDEVLPGSHGVPSGQWNFTDAHRRRQAAAARPRQRAGRRPRAPVRARALPTDASRREVAAGHRAHARPDPRVRQSRRPALQRGRHARRSRRRPIGCRTTGATSTARSTPSTSARERPATGTRSARPRQPAEVPQLHLGAAQHPGAAAGIV